MSGDNLVAEIRHLEELLNIQQRRKRLLEEQIAHQGHYTPVHVRMEFEDTVGKIDELTKELLILHSQRGFISRLEAISQHSFEVLVLQSADIIRQFGHLRTRHTTTQDPRQMMIVQPDDPFRGWRKFLVDKGFAYQRHRNDFDAAVIKKQAIFQNIAGETLYQNELFTISILTRMNRSTRTYLFIAVIPETFYKQRDLLDVLKLIIHLNHLLLHQYPNHSHILDYAPEREELVFRFIHSVDGLTFDDVVASLTLCEKLFFSIHDYFSHRDFQRTSNFLLEDKPISGSGNY